MNNPNTDSWLELQNFPSEARVAGTQFSFNGKGYILSGDGDDHGPLDTGEFLEYSPDIDTWNQLSSHPGDAIWAPGSFVIGCDIYFLLGQNTITSNYPTTLYNYKLSQSCGCTDPNADNYDTAATENDGSCVYTCDEDAGQVSTSITCDGGTWQGEITWQIYDSANNLVASGGAPYANEICLLDDECYSVEMQDSIGDGWNGNILTIGDFEVSLYAGEIGNETYN